MEKSQNSIDNYFTDGITDRCDPLIIHASVIKKIEYYGQISIFVGNFANHIDGIIRR